LRLHIDAEAVAQPFQRDAQMHLALSPQHDVVGLRIERQKSTSKPVQLPLSSGVLAARG
jgi:hypothetical protein